MTTATFLHRADLISQLQTNLSLVLSYRNTVGIDFWWDRDIAIYADTLSNGYYITVFKYNHQEPDFYIFDSGGHPTYKLLNERALSLLHLRLYNVNAYSDLGILPGLQTISNK